jgi:hypothetical protein
MLIERGVLVPAIRSSAASLHAVWHDLSTRVPYVPDERYVRFIDERLGKSPRIAYQADKVSKLFRAQVLATFAPDNSMFRIKTSVRQAVHEYAMEQETLYYIRLRQWMDDQMAIGRMTDRQRVQVDRAVAAAYRHNVPKSIDGSLIDVPINPRDFWTPIDVHIGRESVFASAAPADFAAYPMRPFALSPRVLGRLPAETLLAIRADPARKKALRRLEEFRQTGKADPERLAGDLERFLYSAEEIAYAETRGELHDLIRTRRRTRRHANLTVTGGLGLAVAGLSIWGTVGDVATTIADASGYVALAVTAWGSIRTLRGSGAIDLRGYMVGRALPNEHRLVISGPRTPQPH